MRKVKVLKYERKSGDNYYSKVDDGTALFHQWGINYEEFENGGASFSTAIIERDDGKVENIAAEMIVFVDKKER